MKHKVLSTKLKAQNQLSNTQPSNCSLVLFRVRIGKEAGFELVELPNFEIRQVSEYGDVAAGGATEHALTRSVRDSAALLDATSGPALGDPYWAPPPARPFAQEIAALVREHGRGLKKIGLDRCGHLQALALEREGCEVTDCQQELLHLRRIKTDEEVA